LSASLSFFLIVYFSNSNKKTQHPTPNNNTQIASKMGAGQSAPLNKPVTFDVNKNTEQDFKAMYPYIIYSCLLQNKAEAAAGIKNKNSGDYFLHCVFPKVSESFRECLTKKSMQACAIEQSAQDDFNKLRAYVMNPASLDVKYVALIEKYKRTQDPTERIMQCKLECAEEMASYEQCMKQANAAFSADATAAAADQCARQFSSLHKCRTAVAFADDINECIKSTRGSPSVAAASCLDKSFDQSFNVFEAVEDFTKRFNKGIAPLIEKYATADAALMTDEQIIAAESDYLSNCQEQTKIFEECIAANEGNVNKCGVEMAVVNGCLGLQYWYVCFFVLYALLFICSFFTNALFLFFCFFLSGKYVQQCYKRSPNALQECFNESAFIACVQRADRVLKQ